MSRSALTCTPLLAWSVAAALLPAMLLAAAPVSAGEPVEMPAGHVVRTMDAQGLVSAACPGRAIQRADMDVARRVDKRAALTRVITNTRHEPVDPIDPIDPSAYSFADDPEEAAEAMRTQYGPDSFITRGAQTVRALADAAGRGTQAPLAGLGRLTDAIVDSDGARSRLADVTIEPRVGIAEAGINLSTTW